jgi:hypothetical protein
VELVLRAGEASAREPRELVLDQVLDQVEVVARARAEGRASTWLRLSLADEDPLRGEHAGASAASDLDRVDSFTASECFSSTRSTSGNHGIC